MNTEHDVLPPHARPHGMSGRYASGRSPGSRVKASRLRPHGLPTRASYETSRSGRSDADSNSLTVAGAAPASHRLPEHLKRGHSREPPGRGQQRVPLPAMSPELTAALDAASAAADVIRSLYQRNIA